MRAALSRTDTRELADQPGALIEIRSRPQKVVEFDGHGHSLLLTGLGEISTTTAGDELFAVVENLRFGGRERAADLDDVCARHQGSRQGGAMIVDAHVDCRNPTAQLRRDRIVASKIDEGRK